MGRVRFDLEKHRRFQVIMALRLRLARKGTHKRPFYWIVAADSRQARNGRFLEKLGTYDPRHKPSKVELKTERISHWLDQGARPSDAVREILRDQGVLKARADAGVSSPEPEGEPASSEA